MLVKFSERFQFSVVVLLLMMLIRVRQHGDLITDAEK